MHCTHSSAPALFLCSDGVIKQADASVTPLLWWLPCFGYTVSGGMYGSSVVGRSALAFTRLGVRLTVTLFLLASSGFSEARLCWQTMCDCWDIRCVVDLLCMPRYASEPMVLIAV